MTSETTFYAYLHARPRTVDATGVFYVGKGQRDRYRDFSHRTPHHKNIVAKHGVENLLIGKYDCSSEAVAMDLERGLIKRLRAMGVRIVNFTDGGEGLSGHRHREESKAAIGRAHRGRKHSAEVRARMSIAQTLRYEGKEAPFKGRTHTIASRALISQKAKGRPNPSARHPKSPETIAKIRATKALRPIVECSHCHVSGREGGAMKRYHFDNCPNIGLPKFTVVEVRARNLEDGARRYKEALARRVAHAMLPHVREAMSKRFRENNPSSRPEVKVLRAIQGRKNWADPEIRDRTVDGLKASWTDERRQRFSETNPSHRADVNAKKSAALKGRPQERAICPHCGLEGGLSPMIRYHFDNCKKKED